MAKRRKIASLPTFGHLPDEIILEIFTYLEFRDNASASQVSKRWKLLSEDQSLWQKINLSDRRVPAKFIEKALRHGCQYLSLCDTEIKYLPKNAFSAPNQLKYLSISCSIYYQDFFSKEVSHHEVLMKNLLSACQSLEKLSIRFGNQDQEYGTHFQPNIIQNSPTLTVLRIRALESLSYETAQLIFTNCLELTEVSFMVR